MIEQIIDEIQASLTELRGWLRDGGKKECLVCGFKHPKIHPAFGTGVPDSVKKKLMGECTKCAKIEAILEERIHGNMPDCRCGICMRVVDVIWPDSKPETVGGCICISPILPNHDCPQHGWEAIYKRQKAAYDRLNKTPDLPLAAMVAEALGEKNIQFYEGDTEIYVRGLVTLPEWIMESSDKKAYCIIPNYPTDLEAAMGAFWKYLQKIKATGFISFGQNATAQITINNGSYWSGRSEDAAEGFCLAIVAHREHP